MSKSLQGSGITTRFTWDLAEGLPMLLQETTGASVNYYVTGLGGQPLVLITSAGQTYFYHSSKLGSTRALTDATGAVVQTYDSDPYGRPSAATGSVSNPLQFAGQYTDSESGFQYLRARYYDPATHQFLGRDPIESITRQIYSYAAGSPTNFGDPQGLCWDPVEGGGADECGGGGGWLSTGELLEVRAAQRAELAKAEAGQRACDPNALGQEGEAAAFARLGRQKTTETIESISGATKFRRPDSIDPTTKIITEVKNRAYQANTRQLRDYVGWAGETDTELNSSSEGARARQSQSLCRKRRVAVC